MRLKERDELGKLFRLERLVELRNRFARGLRGISVNTANDAAAARRIADIKMQALSQAERRRAVVEERAERQARVIAKGGETPVLGARRKTGTGLE